MIWSDSASLQSTVRAYIGDNPIATTELHKDLGVIMSNNLSWAEHSSRAYKLLGLVRRSLSRSHHPNIKKILYISLIRSQLTYCSQVWRPHLLKHIMSLERVQRRATKFILNDFSSDYKSRLVVLQIFPLMMQLEVNDIILLMILTRSLYPHLSLFVLDPAALQLI